MEIVLQIVIAAGVAAGVAMAMMRSRGPRGAAAGGSTVALHRPRGDRRRGGSRPGGSAEEEDERGGAGTSTATPPAGEQSPGEAATGDAATEERPDQAAPGAVATDKAAPGAVATGLPTPRGRTAGKAKPSSRAAGQTADPAAALDGGEADPAARAAVRSELEAELRERRAEIARIEERILTKEDAVDVRLSDVERRERSLDDRQRNLDQSSEKLKRARQDQVRELERIAGLSAAQARQLLLRELEDELRSDSARLVRQVEEQARRESDRRARSILSTVMQRVAGGHAAETTVSVVSLPSDDLKGRIIGREGRNIRALEMLTGIDFIVDDTPGAVILSGFDGVRREIARLTLEKLLQDGRIHPARIEEAYYQARSEIENHIAEVGEQAVLEANVGTMHPELTKLLGRLHYRTSYGQNVLAHSIECAHLAGLLAAELGASVRTASRAALLHDVGKAVTHEIEGPHALVGGDLARRHKEAEAVAHAMEAHHNEVEMQTVEAVIVQIVDALSGARPGARGESLEHYTKRLRELEEIAKRHTGVEKVYAMQAGREIRVIVQPEEVDDDSAAVLSHRIARDVERELEYAGQIKVTVIRECRAVDFAK